MPLAKRTPTEREQDRTKLAQLTTDLRADANALQSAIAALPAPASRTAAQQRDALIMRTLIRVIRFSIIASRAGTAADRGSEPA
jgi:hypothetical protein